MPRKVELNAALQYSPCTVDPQLSPDGPVFTNRTVHLSVLEMDNGNVPTRFERDSSFMTSEVFARICDGNYGINCLGCTSTNREFLQGILCWLLVLSLFTFWDLHFHLNEFFFNQFGISVLFIEFYCAQLPKLSSACSFCNCCCFPGFSNPS